MLVRPWLVKKEDPGTIFLRRSGHSFTPDSLTELVGDYVEQAGIEKAGACHLFRHAMATHMLNRGANLKSIQQLLGHKKLTTTGKYTLVAIEELKKIHSLKHPGANLHAERKKNENHRQERGDFHAEYEEEATHSEA